MSFRDRSDAGRHLADAVRRSDDGGHDLVVLALPRGGVPVAFEVANALRAPSTSSWSGNWEFPSNLSWRWGQSARTAYAS